MTQTGPAGQHAAGRHTPDQQVPQQQTPGQLAALEQAAATAGEVAAAVVAVGGGWQRGAGLVIAEGQVATNAHNLGEGPVQVSFADGRTAVAQPVGVDVDRDLAVLAVDTAGLVPPAWTGQPDLVVGTSVFAVTTDHLGGRRVTFGTISAINQRFRGPRGRPITGALEHTAPLPRGSSGGPLVDASGSVVGLNTHRRGDGFYLALSATAELRSLLEALGRGESPRRLRLGVAVAPADVARRLRRAVGLPARGGVLVRQVSDRGPAARAGLRSGDLIVSAAGQAVTDGEQLVDILDRLDAGAELPVEIVRGSEELDLVVRFDPAQETADE